MATAIVVPNEYGYVIATTAATFFVGMWHGMRVGPFRKAAGIKYPQYYAESTDFANATPEKKQALYLFNCAQRAHGNWMESHPSVAIAMLVAGVQYPVTASILGAGWILSRLVYAIGYTRKDGTTGKGRMAGAPFWLFQIGLFGLTAWSGVKMVM